MPAVTDEAAVRLFVQHFHDVHERVYGYASRGAPVELLNVRVVQSSKPDGRVLPMRKPAPAVTHTSSRRAFFAELGGFVDVPALRRESLTSGTTLEGPLFVDQDDTTVVIYPGHRGVVDPAGNIVVSVGAER